MNPMVALPSALRVAVCPEGDEERRVEFVLIPALANRTHHRFAYDGAEERAGTGRAVGWPGKPSQVSIT